MQTLNVEQFELKSTAAVNMRLETNNFLSCNISRSSERAFVRCSANRARTRPYGYGNRHGTILALSVVMISTLLIISGLCINLAYVELVRSEQRLANDASTKAAAVMLGKSQSITTARLAAKTIAAKHLVAGQPLAVIDSMIDFGVAQQNSDGSFTFTPQANPQSATTINSVRITSNLNGRSGGGAEFLAFSQVTPFGDDGQAPLTNFSPSVRSIATRIDIDLCLVVDRSASMAWDMTNVAFSYPAELHGKSPIQNYLTIPHATGSRWAAMNRGIAVFTQILSENPFHPQVALASYASDCEFGVYHATLASLDQKLGTDYSGIPSKISAIATKPLIGNTNVSAGLRIAIDELLNPTDSSKKRITSTKHVVLLCDGMMTAGTGDPVAIARVARDYNVRVSTIAFGTQADVALMQDIATAGGGTSYVALDEAQLTQVFRSIAATLPSVLTE